MDKHDSYRFDVRSKEGFARDIKTSHIAEAEIAVRLCIAVHSKTKEWPELIPNGVDFTGEFIEKNHKITSDADFKIGPRSVEITRADVVCKRYFHIKESKVNRMLERGDDFVFVNGYKAEKQPQYIWLTPEEINEFTIKANTKYGKVLHPGSGRIVLNKAAYRYDLYWFKNLWKSLPVLFKGMPSKYLEILDQLK
jgi:hypothetical protein